MICIGIMYDIFISCQVYVLSMIYVDVGYMTMVFQVIGK